MSSLEVGHWAAQTFWQITWNIYSWDIPKCVKGQLIWKVFLVSSILPKTNRKIPLFYDVTSSRIVFVCFLGELKTPKRHFEINWPLEGAITNFWRFWSTLFVVIKLISMYKQVYFYFRLIYLYTYFNLGIN